MSTGSPLEPPPLAGDAAKRRVASVVAGSAHVLLVDTAGDLLAMGDNSFGQCGLGSPEEVRRSHGVGHIAWVT